MKRTTILKQPKESWTSNNTKPIHICPGCGQRVTVYSGREGTNSYEPYAENECKRYREALEKIKRIDCYCDGGCADVAKEALGVKE